MRDQKKQDKKPQQPTKRGGNSARYHLGGNHQRNMLRRARRTFKRVLRLTHSRSLAASEANRVVMAHNLTVPANWFKE